MNSGAVCAPDTTDNPADSRRIYEEGNARLRCGRNCGVCFRRRRARRYGEHRRSGRRRRADRSARSERRLRHGSVLVPNWYRQLTLFGRVDEIRDDSEFADIDRLSLRYSRRTFGNRADERGNRLRRARRGLVAESSHGSGRVRRKGSRPDLHHPSGSRRGVGSADRCGQLARGWGYVQFCLFGGDGTYAASQIFQRVQ